MSRPLHRLLNILLVLSLWVPGSTALAQSAEELIKKPKRLTWLEILLKPS